MKVKMNFNPIVFDCYDSWLQTINDRRYHYNMNFFDFMSIYQSYRSGIETEVKEEEIIKEDIDTNGILTQSEIDALFDKV
tara:strand:+ start:1518 stop:1757 length:240 start_codon:yes stop_codon:yes gene_type:complete